MDDLPQVVPYVLGRRLSDARKARGITQVQAAKYLGCSRPTLIAIEKGTRRSKPGEIIRLAKLYGRTVHELVRVGKPVTDFKPHLRAAASKLKQRSTDLNQAISKLQRFAEDYHQLEAIMEAPLAQNYPAELDLSRMRVDIRTLAEDAAANERQRLGLGDQPIHYLRRFLEDDVGLRVLYWKLPSPIAGMYAYVAEVGCCIMVNHKHPPERRRASLAHEYGHVITDRYKPGIDHLRPKGRRPANERFCEAFGMSFLMPAVSVRRRFSAIAHSTGDFRVADLCRLSHHFFVSVEAMSYRLENLGLIPQGTIRYLRESRFEVRKASTMLDLSQLPEEAEILPERYRYLAVQAYVKGKLSEGQLAEFLNCDRITAREAVAICLSSKVVDGSGEVRNLRLDSGRSLL
jgi:Zn-dependent peptidase ImmA (M78 family)/DNA-binding XRE family transcriptional regulator